MRNSKDWLKQIQYTLAALVMVVLVSCSGKEEVGSTSLITGASSKTWKTDKSIDATGDKEKLTDQEENEALQFFADGRFSTSGGAALQTGTWTFDQAAKTLSLQFEGAATQEVFNVTKLTEDEMRLKAPDGSEMVLSSK
ncbi:lipocalin family protein [Pontibacter arcticus]|nr:lipocalin family protein [Pontibacter arcticus]